MGVLQLISSRNFIVVNKELLKAFGIDEAILLGELASEYDYWEKQEKINDGFFFSTIENVEENTTLSAHKQRKALNKLQELNIVEVSLKDIPAKRYIKINEEQLFKIFNIKMLKNLTSSSEKNEYLDVKKINVNNNNYNKNNKNNKEINKENIRESSSELSPAKAAPQIPYDEIINYLNFKVGVNYKSTTKNTQRLIKARFNEGFTLDDFKQVIDKMSAEWLKDKKMQRYLRPETLFGTKFESYLNKKEVITTKTLAKFYDWSDF